MAGLNESTGRRVGVYPELKAPDWHREEGLEMEEAFLEIARSYDLGGLGPPVFVQSFEADSLRRLRATRLDFASHLVDGRCLPRRRARRHTVPR